MSRETVKAYLNYREQRKALQRAARVKLEEDLKDLKIALGGAFVEDRRNGALIEQISDSISNKNKSFIYEMMAVYKAHEEEQAELAQQIREGVAENLGYTIKMVAPGTVEVYFDNGPMKIISTDENGMVSAFPDAWLVGDANERELYKKIIREIEEYVGS